MLDRGHPFFPTFERLMADAAAHKPVYDLGTNGRFAKEIGLVRHLFEESTYKAGGYRPEWIGGSSGCDFHCDIQDLNGIADQSIGSVVSLSVLEHVVNPLRAVQEIARILRPGGLAIVSVPFFYGYHGKSARISNPMHDRNNHRDVDSAHSGYGDFWRITHEGLGQLFAQAGFSRVDVFPIDGPLLALLTVRGLYHRICSIPLVSRVLGVLDRPRLGGLTSMHYVRAEK